MNLVNLGCTLNYSGSIIPSSKSFDIEITNCDMMIEKNFNAGIPNNITENNMIFSISHSRYKLIDLFTIRSGTFGNEGLDSELTEYILSQLQK